MGTKSKVKGLNEWKNYINSVPDKIIDEVTKEVENSGGRVEGGAKQLAPVDTGRLRADISSELTLSGRVALTSISSSVDYASVVEYGSMNRAPQPYMIPSFNREVSNFTSNIQRAYRRGFK